MKLSTGTPRHPIRHFKTRIRYRLWHTTTGVSVTCSSRVVVRSSDEGILLENKVYDGADNQTSGD